MTTSSPTQEDPTEGLPELATRRQVAKLTQIHENTLGRWAAEGKGPKFIRIGGPHGAVRYRRDDVLAWIEASASGAA